MFLSSCTEDLETSFYLQAKEETAKYKYTYDLTDIQGILDLANTSSSDNLNLKNGDEIVVDYSGRYWEDFQHATCVPPPNVCFIVIEHPADLKSIPNSPNDMTFIKVLPNNPEAIKISELTTEVVDGITLIYYK
jgi:hypothetical protein